MEPIRLSGVEDHDSLCEMDMCDGGISRRDVWRQPKVAKLGAFSETAPTIEVGRFLVEACGDEFAHGAGGTTALDLINRPKIDVSAKISVDRGR